MASTLMNRLSLSDTFSLGPRYADRHVGYWLQKRCGASNKLLKNFLRGVSTPKREIVFKVEEGARFTDVLGNGELILIVSQKFVDVLSSAGFLGWHTYPIKLYDKSNTLISKPVFGIGITGRAGPIDKKRGVVWTKLPHSKRRVPGRNGLYFNTSNWDGSDIFMLEDANYVLITRRVAEALEKAKLSGFKAKPVSDVKF